MVDVLVDLLGITVLLEETSQNTDSAHPEDVRRHTGLGGTLSFTSAEMATLALSLVVKLDSVARVHGDLTSHDETILVKLSNILA